MTANEIKKLRDELGVTQEELATILGVSKVSVARYEASGKNATSPQGEVEKKLSQLQGFLENPEDKKKILELRHKKGGIAALAGFIAIGTAAFPAAIAIAGAIPLAALGAAAPAILLGKFLTSLIGGDRPDDRS